MEQADTTKAHETELLDELKTYKSELADIQTVFRRENVDPDSVSYHDMSSADSDSCMICMDGYLQNEVIVRHVGHGACSRSAHARCWAEWLKRSCQCVLCKGCMIRHKNIVYCLNRRINLPSAPTGAIPNFVMPEGNAYTSGLTEEIDEDTSRRFVSADEGDKRNQIPSRWLLDAFMEHAGNERNTTQRITAALAAGTVPEWDPVVAFLKVFRAKHIESGRAAEITSLNNHIQHHRAGWLQHWNSSFIRFLDADRGTDDFLRRRVYWNRIELAFINLKKRERLIDAFYMFNLDQIEEDVFAIANNQTLDGARLRGILSRHPQLARNCGRRSSLILTDGIKVYLITEIQKMRYRSKKDWMRLRAGADLDWSESTIFAFNAMNEIYWSTFPYNEDNLPHPDGGHVYHVFEVRRIVDAAIYASINSDLSQVNITTDADRGGTVAVTDSEDISAGMPQGDNDTSLALAIGELNQLDVNSDTNPAATSGSQARSGSGSSAGSNPRRNPAREVRSARRNVPTVTRGTASRRSRRNAARTLRRIAERANKEALDGR